MRGRLGEAVDELVAPGVAEFLSNQALQVCIVGSQPRFAVAQARVVREQLVPPGHEIDAMLAQNHQIPRPQGSA